MFLYQFCGEKTKECRSKLDYLKSFLQSSKQRKLLSYAGFCQIDFAQV